MKGLVIGRTSAGKDTLKGILEKDYGWEFVKSYTTRPKRYPDEDTHIFITQEEADAEADKVATTVINGYEYFATRTQVEACDGYIIDPRGAEELMRNMPEERFFIIYLTPSNWKVQKKMAVARAADPKMEAKIFEERSADEAAQFTYFEEEMPQEAYKNCVGTLTFANDYTPETLEHVADIAADFMKQQANVYERRLADAVKQWVSTFDGVRTELVRDSMELHPGDWEEVTETDDDAGPDDILPMRDYMYQFGDGMDDEWLFENNGVRILSECGLRVYKSERFGYFFGIDGNGYSSLEEHWIPLFKARNPKWYEI